MPSVRAGIADQFGFDLEWNGDMLYGAMRDAATKGVFLAAQRLKEQIQINISVVGPPHSLPGEMPHLITGNLQDSVKVKAKGLEADVVVEAPYAYALEFGTSRMAPRPFINRTFTETFPELQQIITDTIEEDAGVGRFFK